jgi:starch phosphorylase
MKESMKALCPQYSTNRMTFEYTERFYLPADEDYAEMREDNFRLAKETAHWKEKIRKGWSSVRILEVSEDNGNGFKVDDYYKVTARVYLGQLGAEDVSVELYYGLLDENQEIISGEASVLDFISTDGNGISVFSGKIPLKSSGIYGFSARVRPNHKKLWRAPDLGFVTWEEF